MKNKVPWIAVGLAIVHAMSGFAILLVSSWFIAVSAIAAVGFNYVIPAVSIRALALTRIASGYAEMWLNHHTLLDNLQLNRMRLFTSMKNQLALSKGAETDKLHYQTEDVAAVWAGWVSQNAGAFASLMLLWLFVILYVPDFQGIWFWFFALSIVIYGTLIWSGLSLAKHKVKHRVELEHGVEHHFSAASLWHMQPNLKQVNADALWKLEARWQQRIDYALSGLLVVSLISSLAVFLYIETPEQFAPISIVLPMAMLAAMDWFGRSFYSHNRLLDYRLAKKSLDETQQTLCSKTISNTEINQLSLKSVRVAGMNRELQNLSLSNGQMCVLEGSSGTGKSRCLQAIAGLIPMSGRRLLNDKEESSELLADVLYTEQLPYCLSASVKENLLIAAPNASDIELIQALEQVNLTGLKAFGSWIGDGGRKLSGGELKRLGLARAILSKRHVLLLDEPFEGLDQENLNKVVQVINELKRERIVIVATHILPETLAFNCKVSLD
jgi:ATP-binding cassette subfamily C protein CydC